MRLTIVAQALRSVDDALHAHRPTGLHFLAKCFARTPDGFSAELKAEHAEALQQALRTRRVMASLLPRSAPNDPPALPGAA